jgi:Ras-related protein Rab-1A
MTTETKLLPIQKILIVGDAYVGKSSLLFKYVDNVFMNSSATIGTDFKIKIHQYNDLEVKLQIWDSGGGRERYQTISSAYYRGADAVIVCFDLTNEESFKNLGIWIQQIKKHASKDVLTFLIGTKADLVEEQKISQDRISLFSHENKMNYFPLSSKTGENVDFAMNRCINELIEKNKHGFEEQILQRMKTPTNVNLKENDSFCRIL